jgi:hypothetical protein
LNGCPEDKNLLPNDVMPYYQYRAELSVVDGLVFKGERLIIPSSMWKEIKEKIHQGHMGIEKCKVRARQVVFRPGINAEITEIVSRCPACIKYQEAQKKQPLKPYDVPAEPWYKVVMDLATYKNKDYLVIVDYFSNYPGVCPMANTRSSAIISHKS